MWPDKNITKKELEAFRVYIADRLDAKIRVVADRKLEEWRKENIRNVIEGCMKNNDVLKEMISKAVSKEFERIMIVRLKGD